MAQSEKDYGRSSRQRNTLDPRNPGAHRRNSSDSDREAFNAVRLPDLKCSLLADYIELLGKRSRGL